MSADQPASQHACMHACTSTCMLTTHARRPVMRLACVHACQTHASGLLRCPVMHRSSPDCATCDMHAYTHAHTCLYALMRHVHATTAAHACIPCVEQHATGMCNVHRGCGVAAHCNQSRTSLQCSHTGNYSS
eukprot:363202-Chlamydomonas_euryale.AAC.2